MNNDWLIEVLAGCQDHVDRYADKFGEPEAGERVVGTIQDSDKLLVVAIERQTLECSKLSSTHSIDHARGRADAAECEKVHARIEELGRQIMTMQLRLEMSIRLHLNLKTEAFRVRNGYQVVTTDEPSAEQDRPVPFNTVTISDMDPNRAN